MAAVVSQTLKGESTSEFWPEISCSRELKAGKVHENTLIVGYENEMSQKVCIFAIVAPIVQKSPLNCTDFHDHTLFRFMNLVRNKQLKKTIELNEHV